MTPKLSRTYTTEPLSPAAFTPPAITHNTATQSSTPNQPSHDISTVYHAILKDLRNFIEILNYLHVEGGSAVEARVERVLCTPVHQSRRAIYPRYALFHKYCGRQKFKFLSHDSSSLDTIMFGSTTLDGILFLQFLKITVAFKDRMLQLFIYLLSSTFVNQYRIYVSRVGSCFRNKSWKHRTSTQNQELTLINKDISR